MPTTRRLPSCQSSPVISRPVGCSPSCARAVDSGRGDASLLALDSRVTDCNSAFFDVANNFHGCIAGIHEVLRRQGLLDQEHPPAMRVLRTEAAFEGALVRARCAGDIPANSDTKALARFLVSNLHGLRVLARAGAERAVLVGGHLDSVPNGGWLDGVLGVERLGVDLRIGDGLFTLATAIASSSSADVVP